MDKIKINDVEYNVPTSWEEITFEQYINFVKLEEIKTDFMLEELYLINLIEVLCEMPEGSMNDLTMIEFNELVNKFGYLNTDPKLSKDKQIDINGITYVFPDDLNKLTLGENISIKTLIKDQNKYEQLYYILGVILRPGKIEIDAETKKEVYVQDKFTGDMNKINFRINLFKKVPFVKLLGQLNFFLIGKEL